MNHSNNYLDPQLEPKTLNSSAHLNSISRSITDTDSLSQWIENNPDYAHLVDCVDRGETIPRNKRLLAKILIGMKKLLIATPDEFHGTAYVTPKVQRDATVTARVVTASHWLDAIGNAPLLFFAFSNLGILPALTLAVGLDLVILKFSNDAATVAVRGIRDTKETQNNKAWARWAVILGLIPISLLQCVSAGIGIELFNNSSQLHQIKAKILVEEQLSQQKQQLDNLKQPDSPQYQAAANECLSGEAELRRLSHTDPRWNSRYVQLYGQWTERKQSWDTVPLEQLPTCRLKTRLETIAAPQYEQSNRDLQQTLQRRIKLGVGNDLQFLQKEYPSIYTAHFTPSGEIQSSVELVKIAIENFLSKLLHRDFSKLGLSFFFFCLSLITSTTACAMSITYARRQDVAMSWSEDIRQVRDRWLDQQWQLLIDSHKHNQP
jgi:hypothetical protein